MDWESEFKKHLLKLIQEFDPDAKVEQIEIVGIEMPETDYKNIDTENLGRLYAFTIMREDYEEANKIKEELANRGCDISIDIDEKKKEGRLNISYRPPSKLENISVNLKVLKDGLAIDWDKEINNE